MKTFNLMKTFKGANLLLLIPGAIVAIYMLYKSNDYQIIDTTINQFLLNVGLISTMGILIALMISLLKKEDSILIVRERLCFALTNGSIYVLFSLISFFLTLGMRLQHDGSASTILVFGNVFASFAVLFFITMWVHVIALIGQDIPQLSSIAEIENNNSNRFTDDGGESAPSHRVIETDQNSDSVGSSQINGNNEKLADGE